MGRGREWRRATPFLHRVFARVYSLFDGTSWIIDEKLASLSLHYTSEIGLSVRGLLEEESPLKRKEAEKEAEEDDVVEIPPPQTTKRVKSEYRIITCGDGKEVIEIM